MEFIVGEFYQTRSGLKVVYIGINPLGDQSNRLLFGFRTGVLSCYDNGCLYDYRESGDDVIREFTDIPKVGSIWETKDDELNRKAEVRFIEDDCVIFRYLDHRYKPLDKDKLYCGYTVAYFLDNYKEVK